MSQSNERPLFFLSARVLQGLGEIGIRKTSLAPPPEERHSGRRVARFAEFWDTYVRLGHEIVKACERVNMHPETWRRQERAFGLMRKVYAKRTAIRGQQPAQPFRWNDWTNNDEWNQG